MALQAYERRKQSSKRKMESENRNAAARALVCLQNVQDNVDNQMNSSTDDDDCETSDFQISSTVEVAVQTDLSLSDLQALFDDNNVLREETRQLKQKTQCTFDENLLCDNESIKCLTGLPSGNTAKIVFDEIDHYLPDSASLPKFKQFMLTLIRLRMNVSLQFLAFIFQIHVSTASRIFNKVINIMYGRLVPILVFWPEREVLRKTLPVSFRRTFSKCACIIDCFEVFIERPSDLKARAQTYSNYKNHNTMKYLIGITPQGTISFISKGWGGRTSDKYLTENCGFLDKILPGDVILADRGFTVQESIGLQMAELKIPAFTKGKSQLSALDIETTRTLASQRIHVERVIGMVRQKYTMLQETIPITLLLSDKNEATALDKIVHVACSLCNMCESVVPFE